MANTRRRLAAAIALAACTLAPLAAKDKDNEGDKNAAPQACRRRARPRRDAL
jgi:hypothetical protein